MIADSLAIIREGIRLGSSGMVTLIVAITIMVTLIVAITIGFLLGNLMRGEK